MRKSGLLSGIAAAIEGLLVRTSSGARALPDLAPRDPYARLKRSKYQPHHSERERARRLRQIARGQLTRDNGGAW